MHPADSDEEEDSPNVAHSNDGNNQTLNDFKMKCGKFIQISAFVYLGAINFEISQNFHECLLLRSYSVAELSSKLKTDQRSPRRFMKVLGSHISQYGLDIGFRKPVLTVSLQTTPAGICYIHS